MINKEIENQEIIIKYKSLLKETYIHINDDEKKLIRRAFDLALDAHKDQRRKSGEPYIYHPIAVADIVANEIGLDAKAIAGALLHDVVEDTHYTLSDIEKLFGLKIRNIIDGLTKISSIDSSESSIQSENYRKLLLTISEDIRVVLIKLADRLHNMRTMKSMKPEKQIKIASETSFIYAPLAHRMGLFNIKSELEDLSLQYTNPKEYNEILFYQKESKEDQSTYINFVIQEVKQCLRDNDLTFSIKGRPKSIYSIYKKLSKTSISYDEVFDKFAIRIIYRSDLKNEKFMAWKIFSLITDKFKPNQSRMKDWISQPKTTGYESLHITVMGPQGKWVEVQIRSDRMDEIAEKGIAAHYKYKDGNVGHIDSMDVWLNKLKDVLHKEGQSLNTQDFIDSFKLNLYSKEIYVFTPKGDLKSLPKGATALDFAYEIHSRVGDTCMGAKVNNKIMSISTVLNTGDQVDIITSSKQKPRADWLDFALTAKAKSAIKAILNTEKREFAELGKQVLERKLKAAKITLDHDKINAVTLFFKEQTSLDLFYKIGTGIIDAAAIKQYAEHEKNHLYKSIFRTIKRTTLNPIKTLSALTKKKSDTLSNKPEILVFGDDQVRLNYELSKCCNPLVGDKVFGIITVSDGIKVHRLNCPNAISIRANLSYRIIKAQWINSNFHSFVAHLRIKSLDRKGLLNDISGVFYHLNLNIDNIQSNTQEGLVNTLISVEFQNKTQLKDATRKLKSLEGIHEVVRNSPME